jgi:hypothetical protein
MEWGQIKERREAREAREKMNTQGTKSPIILDVLSGLPVLACGGGVGGVGRWGGPFFGHYRRGAGQVGTRQRKEESNPPVHTTYGSGSSSLTGLQAPGIEGLTPISAWKYDISNEPLLRSTYCYGFGAPTVKVVRDGGIHLGDHCMPFLGWLAPWLRGNESSSRPFYLVSLAYTYRCAHLHCLNRNGASPLSLDEAHEREGMISSLTA